MTMLAMNEFEVGGQVYRVRDRMNGKTAARMLRRCLPVMTPMLNLGGKTPTMDDIKLVVGEIGKLSDETEDYIFDHCFSIVDRKQGEVWAPLKPKNVPDIMFKDIDVMDRYTIVANVISREFGPVFQKLLASLPAGAGSRPA